MLNAKKQNDRQPITRTISWIQLAAVFIFATACNQTNPVIGTNTEQPTADSVQTATVETIAEDPATPTPEVEEVAFWAGSSTDDSIRQTINDLAQADGVVVREITDLTNPGLQATTRLVVADISDAEQESAVLNTAQQYPDLPFIILGGGGVTDLTNVVSLASSAEQTAFIGGYIAAMVTTQWRVGVLNRTDQDESISIRDAFVNGATYFCGSCYYDGSKRVWYPLAADIASLNDWQTGVDTLANQSVFTVYIDPAIDSEEVQTAIKDDGMLFVTAKGYANSDVKSNWVATLNSDPVEGLKLAWKKALSGETTDTEALSIQVTDRNTEYLTDGRMRLVEETIEKLQEGSLIPESVSLEE